MLLYFLAPLWPLTKPPISAELFTNGSATTDLSCQQGAPRYRAECPQVFDLVHSYDVLDQNIVITLYQCFYFDYVTLCMILLGTKAHLPRSARSFLLPGGCAVLARAQELVQYIGKSLGGPSIFSQGTLLSTLGNFPRGFIHHDTPSAFSKIVPV